MAVDKNLAKKLYFEEGMGYAEIGRAFGVSRQYIHKIVMDYGNTGRGNGRERLYKNMGQCKVCKKREAEQLHHKDYDNSNDTPKNLIPVCVPCHKKLHTGLLPLRYRLKKKRD